MAEWRDVYLAQEQRKKQRDFQAALGGIEADTGTPEYLGELARLSGEHGAASPSAVGQMADVSRARGRSEHMGRLGTVAPVFMSTLDRIKQGDTAAIGELDQLMQKHGGDIGQYLNLPDWRHIEGVDAATPKGGGDMLLSPRVRNDRTQTTGPMTAGASAGEDDMVLGRTADQLRPFFGQFTQPRAPGKWTVTKLDDGRAVAMDQNTGKFRYLDMGGSPDGGGAGGGGGGGAGPKITQLEDGTIAWLDDDGILQSANVQSNLSYFKAASEAYGDMNPLSVETATAVQDDVDANSAFQSAMRQSGVDYNQSRMRSVVADLSRNDPDFAEDTPARRREKAVAQYLDVPVAGDLSAGDWVAGLAATTWNQFSDPSVAAEGLVAVWLATGGKKSDADKVREAVKATMAPAAPATPAAPGPGAPRPPLSAMQQMRQEQRDASMEMVTRPFRSAWDAVMDFSREAQERRRAREQGELARWRERQ